MVGRLVTATPGACQRSEARPRLSHDARKRSNVDGCESVVMLARAGWELLRLWRSSKLPRMRQGGFSLHATAELVHNENAEKAGAHNVLW
jgi:hypothetical protein